MENQNQNPEEEMQEDTEQGTDMHVGPGQEQHLPHEAWHEVQQTRRRPRPNINEEDEEQED